MVTVDSTYYLETYLGIDPLTDGSLDRVLQRATADIKRNCPGGIPDESELDAETVTHVKDAICAQAEFYVVNGDTYNESETAGQEQIGSYSRSKGLTQRKPAGSLAPRALQELEVTGLMFRGAVLL